MTLLAVLGSLICGCSTIDYSRRVDGWPALKPEVHYVTFEEMRARCDKYSPALEIPMACSEFFFDEGVCRVWIAGRSKRNEEHELAHCAGYDHPGGRTMHAMLHNWKASRWSHTVGISPDAVIEDSRRSLN